MQQESDYSDTQSTNTAFIASLHCSPL